MDNVQQGASTAECDKEQPPSPPLPSPPHDTQKGTSEDRMC